MKKYYGDRFYQIKTHRNEGGMKVDGVLDGCTVFAVYAPEVYKDLNVINKIKSDFSGVLKHENNGIWKSISKWTFFVKNNQRKDIAPRVMNLITELEGLKDWIFT
jgi:hypothetical protein